MSATVGPPERVDVLAPLLLRTYSPVRDGPPAAGTLPGVSHGAAGVHVHRRTGPPASARPSDVSAGRDAECEFRSSEQLERPRIGVAAEVPIEHRGEDGILRRGAGEERHGRPELEVVGVAEHLRRRAPPPRRPPARRPPAAADRAPGARGRPAPRRARTRRTRGPSSSSPGRRAAGTRTTSSGSPSGPAPARHGPGPTPGPVRRRTAPGRTRSALIPALTAHSSAGLRRGGSARAGRGS